MPDNLQDFKDGVSRSIYGMTAREAQQQGICISCRRIPDFSTTSEAGQREYWITGLCEPCFDSIMAEVKDEE